MALCYPSCPMKSWRPRKWPFDAIPKKKKLFAYPFAFDVLLKAYSDLEANSKRRRQIIAKPDWERQSDE